MDGIKKKIYNNLRFSVGLPFACHILDTWPTGLKKMERKMKGLGHGFADATYSVYIISLYYC